MSHNLAAGETGFTSNSFLVTGERPTLVDAGNDFDVVSEIEDHVDDLAAVVLTHTHPDHVGNLPEIQQRFDVDVYGYDPSFEGVGSTLVEEGTVKMGDHEYDVIHTPGHKDDHVCLYARDPGLLFAGDLVFANGGFGRTDLEEGDRELLTESIERLLETVDDDLAELHVGHGPSVSANPRADIELALQAARMGA
jgi:glyoxylase-like metal-dependent hydrolase (beta-lactamase superfamily II)